MFDKTFVYYQNDPISCQALLNARTQSTSHNLVDKPKFTREQTFEFFKLLEAEKTDLYIEAIQKGIVDKLKQSQDASASDQFMAVQAARSFDKLKIECGVDEVDYQDALAYYKIDSEQQAIKVM